MVGGSEVPPGRWPATAAVYYGEVSTCSGVLVHERLALTAGHCDASSLSHIVVDTVDREQGGERLEVAERHAYPQASTTFDLALLVLDEPATTAPTPLMLGCATAWLEEGAQAQVVGFGNTEPDGGGATTRLHEVEVPILDPDCEEAAADCNPSVMPDGELIAGGEGRDSCIGDSGGPLYLWGPQDQAVLAGITSRAALPAEQVCGDGGIYVRLDAVADWIEETSGETLAEPDCEGWTNTAPEILLPELESMRVGEVVQLQLDVEDPDGWQALHFQVLQAQGVFPRLDGFELELEAMDVGLAFVEFSANDGLERTTARLEVEVLPEPEPAVQEAEPLHGCAHSSGAGAFAALLAYLVTHSRRRSSSSTSPARAW